MILKNRLVPLAFENLVLSNYVNFSVGPHKIKTLGSHKIWELTVILSFNLHFCTIHNSIESIFKNYTKYYALFRLISRKAQYKDMLAFLRLIDVQRFIMHS